MKIVVILIAVTLSLSMVSAGFLDFAEWMIGQGDPNYSPLPEFAPFNASVTVIGADTIPYITDEPNILYVCEGNQTNAPFNVTDNEGSPYSVGIQPTIPTVPFFVLPSSAPATPPGPTTTEFRIRSFTIDKSDIDETQGYTDFSENITAAQNPLGADSKEITITAIEINNAPELTPFGVQTLVYAQGENSTFYEQLDVSDEEGDSLISGIIPNLTFLDGNVLFNMSALGEINYTANASTFPFPLPYVSDIRICVTDQPISPVHPEILNECGQDGSSIQSCFDFQLTITNENRAPIIDDYWPLNLSFVTSGTSNNYFNVSAHDPDGTTMLDMNWSVDGIQRKFDMGVNFSELNYAFPCGVSGLHWVNVTISDGLNVTNLGWNITVNPTACPSGSSGGGGGGGGGPTCIEEWICGEWNTCQNALVSFELGILSSEDYTPIQNQCLNNSLSDEECGFHLRECYDANFCNTTYHKEETLQQCYYTEDPSCNDGLVNCHGGSCEILVDCGGPCDACATCSDGIQNQGEVGIDCGGACPFECPIEIPKSRLNLLRFGLWSVLIIFIAIIIIKIRGIVKARTAILAAADQTVAQPVANNQDMSETTYYTNG